MAKSLSVQEAVLDFYRGVTAKSVERFDDIVSAEPATLVIGTAPGEWVTERARLRFGFELDGPGQAPADRTTPVDPSTSTRSPSRRRDVASPVPTTAGSPYSRATIEAWAATPPVSVTTAATVPNR